MDEQTHNRLEPGSFVLKYKRSDPQSYWHHAHRGIEMLYIYEGRGEIWVDNRTFPIEDHSLVWFQPYQLHRVAVPPMPDRAYVRTNLTMEPQFAERFLAPFPALEQFFRTLWKGHLQRQFFAPVKDTPIAELLEELHAVSARPAPNREEEAGLLVLSLLRLLKKHLFTDEPEAASLPPRARTHAERIAEWLDSHYKRPFRLEELAASLHLSPYHVSHVFKKSAGMTVSDYLTQRRVREACALLADTSLSIREIAAELGGLSASHFGQMFKKAKGVTPDQYRRSIR